MNKISYQGEFKKEKKKKDFNDMTKKDFFSVPYLKTDFSMNKIVFDSVVILPTKYIHDSNFTAMSFVLIKGKIPFGRVGGGVDAIDINGICGLGDIYSQRFTPTLQSIEKSDRIIEGNTSRVAWSMDCLKKSKLIRLFASQCRLYIYRIMSSHFEVYALPEYKNIEEIKNDRGE